MLNGEYRNKVQQSLLHLASSQLEQDNDASMLLATVAGAFLDSFLVNLKAELDEKKEIEHPDLESQQQAIKTSSKKILPKEFYVCRATPSYQVINTNIISSTLKRMRFPSIASQVEAESIEINKRRRDECFAAVQRLPFVSTGAHLLLARDLTENGIIISPEEASRMMVEKKKPASPKNVKKKGHSRKKRKKDDMFF